MTALDKLRLQNLQGKFISVGLDTDIKKIPLHLLSYNNPVLQFNKLIIKATKDLTAAYKINLAFYEADGKRGLENIESILSLIPDEVLTIADGKRGDIGNTSSMYASALYDNLNFDSATLNAYMGGDSVKPFLDYTDKLNFILTLTSNPGSSDFQKLELKNGTMLFQLMIQKVHEWNDNNNCGIVFGATNVNELKNNVYSFKNLPLLIPGIGAQGGDLEKVITTMRGYKNNNFLINVSRGILYKSKNPDFDIAAREELTMLNNLIKSFYK
jgi:orotidine-5'-phosphate decarboxylase